MNRSTRRKKKGRLSSLVPRKVEQKLKESSGESDEEVVVWAERPANSDHKPLGTPNSNINRLYLEQKELENLKVTCSCCGSRLNLNDQSAFNRHPSLEIVLEPIKNSYQRVDITAKLKEDVEPTISSKFSSPDPVDSDDILPSLCGKSDSDRSSCDSLLSFKLVQESRKKFTTVENSNEKKSRAKKLSDHDSESDEELRKLKRKYSLAELDKMATKKTSRKPIILSDDEKIEVENETKSVNEADVEEIRKNPLLPKSPSPLSSVEEEICLDQSDGEVNRESMNSSPSLLEQPKEVASILDMLNEDSFVQPNLEGSNESESQSPVASFVPDSQPLDEKTEGTLVATRLTSSNSTPAEIPPTPSPLPAKNLSDKYKDERKLLRKRIPRLESPVPQTPSPRKRGRPRRPAVVESDEEAELVVDQFSSDDQYKEDSEEELIEISEEEEEEAKRSGDNSEDDFKPFKRLTRSGPEKKKKIKAGQKRKRVRKASSSEDSDDDATKGSGDDEEKNSRRKIRKILDDKKLTQETRNAEIAEAERKKRLKERQQQYNFIAEMEDPSSPVKNIKLSQLVLDVDSSGNVIVEVNKKLVEFLKPHQAEGVKFIYDSTIESFEKLEDDGGGCILAHCMGLGKTLQVVTFIHTVLTNPKLEGKLRTCLVVAPLNTVLNWTAEFKMWINQRAHLNDLSVWELSGVKDNYERAQQCDDWRKEGGVMILGYQMYQRLSRATNIKNKRLVRILKESLVDPGPDMVFCDEGHMLKNEKTAISKAMNEIRTQRRVVLTGTPLQNNLNEYHCMVNFVKPNLLGTKKEFLNRFVNPIKNGQHADSTLRDVSVMKRRAHVLHNLLEGVVQRKDYSALVKFLPPKNEFVLKLCLSAKQIELYQLYLDRVVGRLDAAALRERHSLFADFNKLQRVWTHPYTLHLQQIEADKIAARQEINDEISGFVVSSEEEEEEIVLDDTDSEDEKKKKKGKSKTEKRPKGPTEKPKIADESSDEEELVRKYTTRSRRDIDEPNEFSRGLSTTPPADRMSGKHWWTDYVDLEDVKLRADMSGKLMLLLEILRKCEEIGDKLLVFSQSLVSLNLIEMFLAHYEEEGWQSSQNSLAAITGEHWGWQKGIDYYRMDGGTSAENRKAFSDRFNDPKNLRARLFLISTKAGSLGINLVAANRVIIFDASWNPSHDIQSIFRVYRFGQTKPVNVYRFIAAGTMEEKIYDRQVTKQSLAARVLDEQQIERHFTSADLEALYSLDPPDLAHRPIPMVPKDRLLADMLQSQEEWLYTYHEHDSLLQDIEEEKLTEQERKAAWDEYNYVKEGRANMMMSNPQFMAAANYPLYHQNPMQPTTPEHVIGELIRVGQTLLDMSGERVQCTMGQLVDHLRNQPENQNPLILITKLKEIVSGLQRTVFEKQRIQMASTSRGPLASMPNGPGPSGSGVVEIPDDD